MTDKFVMIFEIGYRQRKSLIIKLNKYFNKTNVIWRFGKDLYGQ
jgi:hypothetical protein